MNEYEVCVVLRVEAASEAEATATANDRLDSVVSRDATWSDVLALEGKGRVADHVGIYVVPAGA